MERVCTMDTKEKYEFSEVEWYSREKIQDNVKTSDENYGKLLLQTGYNSIAFINYNNNMRTI